MLICDRGTGAQQFRALSMGEIHRRRTPTSMTVKKIHLSEMIADHRRNLGRVGKIETLPILQICRSQFIPGDRGYLRFRVFISR